MTDLGWERVLPNWECFFHRKHGVFWTVYVDDMEMARKKQNMAPTWKKLIKNVDLEETTPFLDHAYLGYTQRDCNANELIIEEPRKMFESRISAGATGKLPGWENPHAKTMAWSYDLEGHVRKCVESYCELANEKTEQLYKVFSPCLDDHHFKKEELETVGAWSEVCSQIVLGLSVLGTNWKTRYFMVSDQTVPSVTKWTQACGRRLARLTACIHHTSDHRQYCYVGNTAHHCRLDSFQDSDFAGDLEE